MSPVYCSACCNLRRHGCTLCPAHTLVNKPLCRHQAVKHIKGACRIPRPEQAPDPVPVSSLTVGAGLPFAGTRWRSTSSGSATSCALNTRQTRHSQSVLLACRLQAQGGGTHQAGAPHPGQPGVPRHRAAVLHLPGASVSLRFARLFCCWGLMMHPQIARLVFTLLVCVVSPVHALRSAMAPPEPCPLVLAH